jgi:NitT/TauT family transport system ATP-binding protein
MNAIQVGNVTKTIWLSSGRFETVFDDFSLVLRECETLGIFGPNGCGKTTLFNMISGITCPDAGRISIKGKAPNERNIAYIFQDYRSSLFPWLTIRENIVFPLRIRRLKKTVIDDKLAGLLEIAKTDFDLSKFPYQLSGGQQQYVAVMRGLISNPDVMLADEPFSALDYSNTMWLMEKISEILGRVKIPLAIVAHDLEHLVYLADRIVFLSQKPARVLREMTIKNGAGRDRSRFNYDLLDEIRSEINGIYMKDEIGQPLREI